MHLQACHSHDPCVVSNKRKWQYSMLFVAEQLRLMTREQPQNQP